MICLDENKGLKKIKSILKISPIYLSFHFAGQAGNCIEYVVLPQTTGLNNLFERHAVSHYYVTFDPFPNPLLTRFTPSKILPFCKEYKNIFHEHGFAIDHHSVGIYEVDWVREEGFMCYFDDPDLIGKPAIYVPNKEKVFRHSWCFYKNDIRKGSW